MGLGAGPGDRALVIDIGTTIYGVAGCQKHGASHGYTKVLGHHPFLATRADTGEVLHAQMHKGSGTAESGAWRFIDELASTRSSTGATDRLSAQSVRLRIVI